MKKTETPPWKKPNPRISPAKHLTDTEKAEARARAQKAGRPYPNLVDNMAVTRKKSRPASARP